MQADVAIVGAGVVGCAIARELSRYRLDVVVLEKEADVGFGTSKANSGIVHSGFHSEPGTLKARLCVRGNRLLADLAEELDLLYRRNGLVMVARHPDELQGLLHYLEQGRRNGLADLGIIGRDELLRLEPNLAPTLAGALFSPSGGVIAPYDLTIALYENARRNGVRFFFNSPLVEAVRSEGMFHLSAGERRITARFVVNAAGLYADRAARLIGDDSFVIAPRKGEEYLLDRRLQGLVTRTIFPLPDAVSKGILVIPTYDGNIMLGPTAVATDSPDDLATTSEGWRAILARVLELVPSVNPGDMIASFAGVRAASNRGDFIIAPSPADARWLNAAGIESPGLTAAPAIAEMIAGLLSEAGLDLRPKADFQPERRVMRFRYLSREEQDRLIAGDPAFGRIVCRCELVTEAEIVRAIRAGATTLDGIKFRTRAGMGRCQGGFCLPRLLRIMERELRLNPAELTKRGGGSRILAGWTDRGAGKAEAS